MRARGPATDGDLVTVVTPNYNSAAYLSDTIRSVVEQTYTNWEMVIVDDGSDDGSFEIAQEWAAGEPRIRVVRHGGTRRGAAYCRNQAIDIARGRYIAFLDSDDLWVPHKLATQIPFMTARGTGLCYAAYGKIDEDGNAAGGTVQVPERVTYRQLLRTCVIGCLTAIYDAAALGRLQMPYGVAPREDFALWLDILKRIEVAHGIDERLAFYRIHRKSASADKLHAARQQWKVYRHIEHIALLPSLWYFAHYAVNGYRKWRI